MGLAVRKSGIDNTLIQILLIILDIDHVLTLYGEA